MDNDAIRQAMVERMVASAAEPQEEQVLAQLTSALTPSDWRAIGEIAIPDSWLKQQFEENTISIYEWLDSDEIEPDLVLNLEPIKRRLLGEGSSQIVAIIVDSWPDCGLEDVLALELVFRQEGEIPLVMCRMPEPLLSLINARIAEAFRDQATAMPSSVDLAAQLSSEERAHLPAVKSQLRGYEMLARWLILVPVSLLGLLMAAVVRSWHGWTRWWGVSVLLSGLLTILGALALGGNASAVVAELSLSLDMPALFAEAARSLWVELANQAVVRSLLWGGILAAVGTLMSGLSFLLPAPGDSSIPLSRNRRG
ncbi:MAG: hypothetical protein ACLFWD_13235 [Anaerolineales bacterium]